MREREPDFFRDQLIDFGASYAVSVVSQKIHESRHNFFKSLFVRENVVFLVSSKIYVFAHDSVSVVRFYCEKLLLTGCVEVNRFIPCFLIV